jgi:Family of unknown function (DUF6599)
MRYTLALKLAAGFALLAISVPLCAEKPNVIPLATSSKWLLADSKRISVDDVGKWAEIPAIARECGVKSAQLRTYTLYPEDETVEVLLEDAADVTSAYSLFTLYRNDSMTPVANLPFTEVGNGVAVMKRGSRFIHILEPGDAKSATGESAPQQPIGRQFSLTLSQIQSILVAVGGSPQAGDDARGMPGALPQAGIIPRSEKYLLGEESAKFAMPSFRSSLLGFSQGAEARLATYRNGTERSQVLAVTYPTPQIARQRFGVMENILQINQDQGAQPVYGKLTGSYVILVFGASSRTRATDLLGLFNSTGYVTWNQRYEGDVPVVIQMVRFVLANIFFSFILIAFALFGGLLFFMTKVVARKWFPNSAWGQPEGNTIIRLGL